VFKGLEAWERFAGFSKCTVHTQYAVVWDCCKPACLDLENVELFMLFKRIRQSIALKVDGEQVAGDKAFGVSFDLTHVEQFSVAPLPQGELVNAEGRGERIPRLDQLGVWQRARFPAERLDWQAEHRSSAGRLVKPYLELEAGCFLATYPQDVGLEVLAFPALMVLRELGAD
jgi:hypothetical protein